MADAGVPQIGQGDGMRIGLDRIQHIAGKAVEELPRGGGEFLRDAPDKAARAGFRLSIAFSGGGEARQGVEAGRQRSWAECFAALPTVQRKKKGRLARGALLMTVPWRRARITVPAAAAAEHRPSGPDPSDRRPPMGPWPMWPPMPGDADGPSCPSSCACGLACGAWRRGRIPASAAGTGNRKRPSATGVSASISARRFFSMVFFHVQPVRPRRGAAPGLRCSRAGAVAFDRCLAMSRLACFQCWNSGCWAGVSDKLGFQIGQFADLAGIHVLAHLLAMRGRCRASCPAARPAPSGAGAAA